ncbi:MAG TPA: hypothetical protein DCY53_05230 [Desulfobacteraceae bacterium]|nr:hypothetical protein [Desulfobacteraceae bacterium]
MRKHFLFSCLVIICCVFLASSTWAEEQKLSGTIYVKSKTIAIGVGVSWGEGKLTYDGKEYKFKVSGISLVDLGFSSVEITGEVYNLKSVSDFAGTYAAATAGAKFGDAGGSVSTLKNDKEVVLKIKAKGEGIQLTLAATGVTVKMVK